MEISFSEDKSEIVVLCQCGCENRIHIKVHKENFNGGCFRTTTYLNGSLYSDEDKTTDSVFLGKIRKIWAIIRNKDY